MALSSYPELFDSIASWANRVDQIGSTLDIEDEFELVIPDLIRLAEVEAENRLRVGDMWATANITMTDGIGTLPDDYVEFSRIYELSSPKRPLIPGKEENGHGIEIVGSTIRGFPTSIGNLGIDYFRTIPPLTADNPTNWLLQKEPGIYLWGALLLAMPHSAEDARMAVWGNLRESCYERLESRDLRSRYARAGTRRDASRTP